MDHRGLSQSALSKKAGLSRSIVDSLLERFDADADADAQLKSLRAIATAGEVRLCWLIAGEGSPTGEEAPVSAGPYGRLFSELDGWEQMLEDAIKLAPEVPPKAWEKLAGSVYPTHDKPNVGLIIEIAKALWKARPVVGKTAKKDG